MTERHGSVIVDENAVNVTSVFSRLHEHAILDEDATVDEKTLAALGYKQEFKRKGLFAPIETGLVETNAPQRLLHLGVLLGLILRPGTPAFGGINNHLLPRLFWHRRFSMGVAHLRISYPGNCFQHGRAVL